MVLSSKIVRSSARSCLLLLILLLFVPVYTFLVPKPVLVNRFKLCLNDKGKEGQGEEGQGEESLSEEVNKSMMSSLKR